MDSSIRVSYFAKECDNGDGRKGLAEYHLKKFRDISDVHQFIRKVKSNPYIGTHVVIGSPTIEA